MKAFVTGGAGFIGSHLVEELLSRGWRVVVLDNLSTGTLENLEQVRKNPNLKFIRGDCLSQRDLERSMEGCEIVFHLAANPEVRIGAVNPSVDLEQNVIATFRVLEVMRKLGINKIVFTSSSTVYGDAEIVPTPENVPPRPISTYGASKLACESLISSYCHCFDFSALIFRLANIVGARSRHGVIWDFIQKLRRNPHELEILGDGTQRKSYLHVKDCIQAILHCLDKFEEGFEVFNLGSEDQVTVKEIAGIVVRMMGLEDVRFRFTGGVKGGRGWLGDVKIMLLDISKIKGLGWRPSGGSREAVELAARELACNP